MPEFDVSQRFTIEQSDARGELVRLRECYQAVSRHMAYPRELKALLGEAMCAAVLLSATIKFEGKLSLQLQGEGPLTLLLVQATHDRRIRGLIKWQGETEALSFRQLIGKSQLAITIEPDEGKRYQGIVPLQGESLTECLEHYFLQSEQLATQIWLTADEQTASGFLLQKLPGRNSDESPESWEHITIIAKSITDQELLTLDFETLLHRLFHSETVHVFEQHPVLFSCGCSKERCETALLSLGAAEIKILVAEKKSIAMDCEFCGASHRLELDDLKRILLSANA